MRVKSDQSTKEKENEIQQENKQIIRKTVVIVKLS